MEKLSSILPASPRIKSVDLTDAKPRRPGSPTFGMPEGITAKDRDRVTISSRATMTSAMEDGATYKNPKDFRSAQMTREISRNFFENRLRNLEDKPGRPRPSASGVSEEPTREMETLPEFASEEMTEQVPLKYSLE